MASTYHKTVEEGQVAFHYVTIHHLQTFISSLHMLY